MSSCPRQAQAPPPGVSSPFVLVAGGTPFPSLDLLPEQPVCLSPAGLPLVSPAKDFCQGEGSRGISRLQEGSLPGVSRPGVAGGRLPSASPWHSPPGAQLATARNWGGGGRLQEEPHSISPQQLFCKDSRGPGRGEGPTKGHGQPSALVHQAPVLALCRALVSWHPGSGQDTSP